MKLGEKTSKIAAKGLVNWHIHGTSGLASRAFNPNEIVFLVNKGLPVTELEDLRAKLGLPMEKLAEKIGMSKSTLHRRKDSGRLEAGESDRVLRLARLLGKAMDVLGSEAEGRRWIMSQQFGLGGAIPLDYAGTEVGAREVENLLTRIDYGVYS